MPVRTSRVGKIQIELSREQVAQLTAVFATWDLYPMPPAVTRYARAFHTYFERRAASRWGEDWRPPI